MNFFNRYKKIFLILLFVLVSIGIGYLLYRVFFMPIVSPVTTQPAATTTTSGFPTSPIGQGQIASTTNIQNLVSLPAPGSIASPSNIATGGVTKVNTLTDNSSLGATLSADGKSLQYYNSEDGKFYRVDGQGNITALSSQVFHNVQDVVWSPGGNEAILSYPDGSNINYNFTTNKQVTLPKHWEDFEYSPSGSQIIAKSMGLDVENRWLVTSNSDGSNARGIEQIGENADTVYDLWSPNGQTVAMYTKGKDFDRQDVYFVGLNNENFKSMAIEGRGFQAVWAPEGDRLLYSVYSSTNNLNPQLWISDAEGDAIGANRHSLGVDTWASKCTFGGDTTIYCAVPTYLQEGSGIFPELANTTTDQVYQINTQTGTKKLIATTEEDYSMSNLLVSSDGQYLYFTDNATNRIHKINLK